MELGTARSVRTLAEVDLCEVANQVADDASRLLVLAGAQLDIRWLPVVRADPDAMYSMLQNPADQRSEVHPAGVGPRLSLSSSQVPNGRRTSNDRQTASGYRRSRRVPLHGLRHMAPAPGSENATRKGLHAQTGSRPD